MDFCRQECVDNYGKNVVTPSSQGLNKLEGGQPRYWAQDTFFVCAICNQYAKVSSILYTVKHMLSLSIAAIEMSNYDLRGLECSDGNSFKDWLCF